MKLHLISPSEANSLIHNYDLEARSSALDSDAAIRALPIEYYHGGSPALLQTEPLLVHDTKYGSTTFHCFHSMLIF